MIDNVNSPAHYVGRHGLQVIDVCEDWGLGLHLAAALQYLLRAHKKGREIEDRQKAIWYLERARRHSAKPLASERGRYIVSIRQVTSEFDVPRPLISAIDDILGAALSRDVDAADRYLVSAGDIVMASLHRPEAVA